MCVCVCCCAVLGHILCPQGAYGPLCAQAWTLMGTEGLNGALWARARIVMERIALMGLLMGPYPNELTQMGPGPKPK